MFLWFVPALKTCVRANLKMLQSSMCIYHKTLYKTLYLCMCDVCSRLEVPTKEHLQRQITKLSNYQIAKLPKYQIAKLPNYLITQTIHIMGYQQNNIYSIKLQNYQITNLPNHQISKLPNYLITKLPDYTNYTSSTNYTRL